MSEFAAGWIACGLWGALIQHEWYVEKKIRHRNWFIDLVLNVEMGYVGLLASYAVYK